MLMLLVPCQHTESVPLTAQALASFPATILHAFTATTNTVAAFIIGFYNVVTTTITYPFRVCLDVRSASQPSLILAQLISVDIPTHCCS